MSRFKTLIHNCQQECQRYKQCQVNKPFDWPLKIKKSKELGWFFRMRRENSEEQNDAVAKECDPAELCGYVRNEDRLC